MHARFALAAALLLAVATPAHANGVNTHTWVTFDAIEQLPDGELKRLLSDPEMRDELINGSIFPDGGYAAMHPFGETSHWEPFLTAYIRWMQAELPRPYARGDSRRHVAFLMGLASHSMGDQVFDSTFMKAARGYDVANWSEVLLESFDTATDVMLVDSTGEDYRGAELFVPPELPEVLGDVGITVDTATLENATSAMHTFILAYGQVNGRDPASVERYRTQYPWASANFMDPYVVGNPLSESEVVAAYMLSLWDRLHEVENDANMILSTYPAAGTDGHPTDDALVESQVVIVFGRGMAGEVRDKFRFTDSTGKVYNPRITPIWSTEACLLMFEPEEPWAADETFTVEVLPGITTVDGHVYEQGWSFQFSTRPATTPQDPMSDPTPHVGEPWTGPPDPPPVEDDGGCSAGGGGAAGGLLLIAGLLVLMVRRRRVAVIAGAAVLQISAGPGGRAPHGEPAPRGMVVFMQPGTSCPNGWPYAMVVAGRMIVGTDAIDTVGRVVGTPLGDVEDRGHGHELGAATIDLPFRSISAADGGNQQGAGAGVRPLTGVVSGVPSGLPFIQLLPCVSP